jgi:hypothetical protein
MNRGYDLTAFCRNFDTNFVKIPGAFSTGVKQPGREADHSPPASAELEKKRGPIHPLPQTSSWRSA